MLGKGTLKYGETTADTAIAQVIDITEPTVKQDMTEVSYLDTVSDIKSKQFGDISVGNMVVTYVYDMATKAALLALVGESQKWAIELRNGDKSEFDGVITECGGDTISRDKHLEAKVTIEVTTLPVYTAGTPEA